MTLPTEDPKAVPAGAAPESRKSPASLAAWADTGSERLTAEVLDQAMKAVLARGPERPVYVAHSDEEARRAEELFGSRFTIVRGMTLEDLLRG